MTVPRWRDKGTGGPPASSSSPDKAPRPKGCKATCGRRGWPRSARADTTVGAHPNETARYLRQANESTEHSWIPTVTVPNGGPWLEGPPASP